MANRNCKRGEAMAFVKAAVASDTDECISWPEGWSTKSKTPGRDYGNVRFEGRKAVGAHRVSLHLATGYPLDGPLHALHSCHNVRCINPKHLRWGTSKENKRDCLRDGTYARAGLTELSAASIYIDERPQAVIAAEHGIGQPMVSRIKRKKAWKQIHDSPS